MTRWLYAAVAALAVCLCSPSHADEGMWTFHGFPFAKANAALGTHLDQAWLDRVRSSTIRLSNCTATFVSPEGLILTNHHCVEACLAELSSKEASLVETGFLARTRTEEKRCQTQIADVLLDMEDITAKVTAATAGKAEAAANNIRKSTVTRLESECAAATKRKCEAVTLYQGGQYWLYQYKRYTDVRIVFAPEAGIAAFGGDPDNFQFPRWGLDMGVLRAYEDDKPATPANYLKINFAGPEVGEPVFVSGHPGGTDRLLTVEQLKQQRNQDLPQWLLRYSEIRGRLIQFGAENPANERITADLLDSIQNSIKVRRKQLDALHDDALMERKTAERNALRKRIAATPALKKSMGDPWHDIDTALATERSLYAPYVFIESGGGFQGRLASFARALVRGAAQRQKPDGERFREYTEGSLPRIQQTLAANLPIYPDLERLRLTAGIERMREWLGPDHPLVRRLLAKESPAALAKRVIEGTKLGDPKVSRHCGMAALPRSQPQMTR